MQHAAPPAGMVPCMTAETATARPVALVTGSARRLGAAIARALHAAGYDMALHWRSARTDIDALVAELESRRPGSTLAVQGDLADDAQPALLVAAVVARFGRLDALVNNASGFEPTPVGGTTVQQWDALFASNARAPLFLAQAAAPHLRASHGAIVNMADIHGERPLRGHTVYCMAKAALLMATRSLALELAPEVRVNAVAPGAILWSEGDHDAGRRAGILARTPLGRTGTEAEIADAVLWLLRSAGYTTGQVVRVDGGRLLEG